MKTPRKNRVFVAKTANETIPPASPRGWKNGSDQPPKYIETMTAEATVIATYSAMKKAPNLKAEYSLWYRPTSSAAASARSNGTLLVSANAAVAKTMKPKN